MNDLFRTEKKQRMTTREGLTQTLERRWTRPKRLSIGEYRALSPDEKLDYNTKRAAYVSGGIRLATENSDQAQQLLEKYMRSNVYAPNRSGIMVSADPHMGKTTLITALMEWTYGRFQATFPEPEYRGHVPVVYVQAKPDTSGKALAKSFLNFFGGTPTSRESTADTIDRVIALMQDAGTHLVCIDEFHNIAEKNVGNGRTVDYIKNLHNEVEATFVIAGIDVGQSQILSNTPRGRQLRTRFTEHSIDPYTSVDTAEKNRWRQLLVGFERELPLLAQERNSILQFQSLLMRRTDGNIGALHKLLTHIAIDLIWADSPEAEMLTAERIAVEPLDMASRDAERLALVTTHAASKSRRTAPTSRKQLTSV